MDYLSLTIFLYSSLIHCYNILAALWVFLPFMNPKCCSLYFNNSGLLIYYYIPLFRHLNMKFCIQIGLYYPSSFFINFSLLLINVSYWSPSLIRFFILDSFYLFFGNLSQIIGCIPSIPALVFLPISPQPLYVISTISLSYYSLSYSSTALVL